jgi:hypothetical protein
MPVEALIAARVVRAPMALVNDPHLIALGFWRLPNRPFIGMHRRSSVAFHEDAGLYPIGRATPALGEDNHAGPGEWLCRFGVEIERLAVADVIGTAPQPKRAQSDL